MACGGHHESCCQGVRRRWRSRERDRASSIETPLFSNVVNSTPTSRADYEKQTPMGRIAKAEEVAATATWLCSEAASYVTGAVVPVDGGMTL